MFITDESATAKSSVTFYRCSICVSEHVSSEPAVHSVRDDATEYFDSPSADRKRYLMV